MPGTRLLTTALVAAFLFSASAFARTPIQQFPKIADMYRKRDPANPYRTVVGGLFRQTVKVGDVDRTEIFKAASERGFIAVVPTGSLYNDPKHMPYPRWNLIMYDTFLSKWSRGPDGTLYYMGKAVK